MLWMKLMICNRNSGTWYYREWLHTVNTSDALSIFDQVNDEKIIFLPNVFGCDQTFNKYLKIRQQNVEKCGLSFQFSHSVVSNSLWPHGLQHIRLPCASPTPKACSNSCPLSPSPPAFNLSQHQGLLQWVSSSYQVAEKLEFHLQHQSFQWIFRTYSLRIEWLDLLAVQGTLVL